MQNFDAFMYYRLFLVIGIFIVIGFAMVSRKLNKMIDRLTDFINFYVFYENEKRKGRMK
jgi:hypothetical protein